MKELRGLDLKRAQLVPSSVFSSPEEVVRHGGLSTAQKLMILRRWEFDARRTAGYAGGGDGSMQDLGLLFRIRRALQSLTFREPAMPAQAGDRLSIGFDAEEVLPLPGMVANGGVGGKV